MIEVQAIISALSGKRFTLSDEKVLQQELYDQFVLKLPGISIEREHHLNKEDIPDFLINGHIAVEVKIKGAKKAIYNQCVRYCEHEKVKVLLLITNLSMGFPEQINNKDCYFYKLSRAWL